MVLYKATIPIDPRTKKNSMMIVGTGLRCPVCHKSSRQFVRQSHVHDRYTAEASLYLKEKPQEPISTPCTVVYRFYMQTRRRVDALNLAAAADDLLVNEGILADDNSNIIKSHDGMRVYHDKEHPRTEIEIYDYKEADDG